MDKQTDKNLPKPTQKTAPSPDKRGDKKGDNKQPIDAETGGPKGLEPTRYGDWEKGGRCSDF